MRKSVKAQWCQNTIAQKHTGTKAPKHIGATVPKHQNNF